MLYTFLMESVHLLARVANILLTINIPSVRVCSSSQNCRIKAKSVPATIRIFEILMKHTESESERQRERYIRTYIYNESEIDRACVCGWGVTRSEAYVRLISGNFLLSNRFRFRRRTNSISLQ